MSRYSEYFLNSAASVVQLELLEISHPSFSKTYHIVRNAVKGVTVFLEPAGEGGFRGQQFFEYYPLTITPVGNSDDLDQSMKVNLGDLGALIPGELDRIAADGTFNIRPTVIYRTYRSDDLTQPLSGPVRLEMQNISSVREGSTFEAAAPKLNQTSTGELYNMDRFPMLRGLL